MNYIQENPESHIIIEYLGGVFMYASAPLKNASGKNEFTFSEAQKLCSGLTPFENKKWRMPSVNEIILLYKNYISPKKHPKVKRVHREFLSSLPANFWTCELLNENEATVVYSYGSPEVGKAYIDELAGVWPVCDNT